MIGSGPGARLATIHGCELNGRERWLYEFLNLPKVAPTRGWAAVAYVGLRDTCFDQSGSPHEALQALGLRLAISA